MSWDNTIGTLDDLPEVVRPFYVEEVRSEETGEMLQVPCTHFDEDGEPLHEYDLVPEMEDVTYIVQKPRNDLKEWDFVEASKSSNKPEFTKYCIEKACEAEQWMFHDAYETWFFRPQPKRAQNEDGTFIADDPETPENEAWVDGFTPDMYADQEEPVNSATDPVPVIAQYHEDLAKVTREEAVDSNLTILGGEWQVATKDMENINDAIQEHEYEDYPDDYIHYWIMADNSIRETTVADLKEVRSAKAKRKSDIFNQYMLWRQTDMQEPFEVVL